LCFVVFLLIQNVCVMSFVSLCFCVLFMLYFSFYACLYRVVLCLSLFLLVLFILAWNVCFIALFYCISVCVSRMSLFLIWLVEEPYNFLCTVEYYWWYFFSGMFFFCYFPLVAESKLSCRGADFSKVPEDHLQKITK
jgi:hypothetical protein